MHFLECRFAVFKSPCSYSLFETEHGIRLCVSAFYLIGVSIFNTAVLPVSKPLKSCIKIRLLGESDKQHFKDEGSNVSLPIVIFEVRNTHKGSKSVY